MPHTDGRFVADKFDLTLWYVKSQLCKGLVQGQQNEINGKLPCLCMDLFSPFISNVSKLELRKHWDAGLFKGEKRTKRRQKCGFFIIIIIIAIVPSPPIAKLILVSLHC